MNKITLSIILFLSVFLFHDGSYAQEITGESGDYETTIEKQFTVKPGGSLNIKVRSGDISIESWDNNSVDIIARIQMDVYTIEEANRIVTKIKEGITIENNDITIHNRHGSNRLEIVYEIRVPQKFNLNMRTSGGDITVEKLEGDSEVSTSGGDVAFVDISGQTTVRTSGGDLVFKNMSGLLNAHTSGGDVALENLYAESHVKTSGGDITLVNSTQEVDLNTSGGDIKLDNIGQSLSAHTSGGDIEIRNGTGKNFTLKTSGGEIELINIKGQIDAHTSGGDIVGHSLFDRMNITTSGGDISLENIQAPANVKTSGGDIKFELNLKDVNKPHDLDLQAHGGDIELTLPEKCPATITAEILLDRRGRSWKRYDVYSDFPLSKSMPDETGNGILRSIGKINGGGDAIYLKTTNGNIYIKKAN